MYDAIPSDMRRLIQWGTYEKKWLPERKKYTKIPHNAKNDSLAKTNDPNTWSDFETAMSSMSQYNRDGLAFFFANGYVGLDLDNVADELDKFKAGDWDNEVAVAVLFTDSYVEISQSGNGIHAIMRGEIHGDRRRKKDVELYQDGRFFALTGNCIHKVNETTQMQQARMDRMYDYYFQDIGPVRQTNEEAPELNNLAVGEIIKRAELSKNGARFKAFMKGGWEPFYASQSEADLAFANDLAFWTGRDFNKMDEIFRNSSLIRQKYDEKHGKTTYGIALLNKAINETTNTFNPVKEPLNKYTLNFNQPVKKETPARSWDDTGNADRLMDTYGEYIRYSYIDKAWYFYNGSFWEQDDKGMIAQFADKVVDNLKDEKLHISPDVDPDEAAKDWQKFIKKSRQHTQKKNFVEEAKHRVPVLHGEFDRDPMLLNTVNGYVDLSNGILKEHDIKKMFSQQSNVEYSENIDCPIWDNFLNQVFDSDQSLIDYIQKAVGYSATGSTSEQVMFILFGGGRNGKSVFINTIAHILGTYSKTMGAGSIMVKANNNAANSDIARLEGARMVISSEPNEGVRLDEGLVKQLTGGDTVTARYLYGKEFEFNPQFKLWLATNHKPIIRGTDDGIWRRLMMVPFQVQIPAEKVDKKLESKLMSEAVGILNWIVDGAIKWQKEGLNPPASVLKASKEYRDEMDVITMFVSDCCEVGPDKKIPAGEIFKKYQQWAKDNSEYSMSKQKFGKEMRNKFEYKKGKQGRFYKGLTLIQDQRLNFIKN